MARFKVLVTDNAHQSAVDVLAQESDIEIVFPAAQTRDAVKAAIAGVDAILIRSATKLDAEMIDAAPNLRVVARAGVGVDNVDIEKATSRGIAVMNTPDGNTIATAEFTFGLMLAMLRQIPQAHQSMNEGKWDRKSFMGVELRGKTLGVVGLGRIGRAVARRAIAFEMRVVAYDAYDSARELARAEKIGVELVELDELFAQADIISLHPSLDASTRGMINTANIAKMKKGVYIINAARGALINDADLAAALTSGQVGGAALDVYDPEPPAADNPLLSAPNVLHTPHLAASTEDAQINVAVDAATLIAAALTQGDYRNVLNPAALSAAK